MDIRVFFTAVFFGFFETAYFGWNISPQSDAEMICAGIAFLIFALSFKTNN